MELDDEYIWKPTLWRDPLNWFIEQAWNKPTRVRTWWRWRHNPAPEPDDQPILDKHGQTYWLRVIENDPLSFLNVFYCGDCVGYVNLFWNRDEKYLDLSDISINRKHRARGLGTVLITRVEGIAKERGARMIKGRVVADDLKRFPELMNWYRKQGFTTSLSSLTDLTSTVAGIEKVIGLIG